MTGKNNAKLTDIHALLAAGIDPRTGLPIKLTGKKDSLESDLKKLLRIKDESEFCNRLRWWNTGLTISSAMLERFLYYKYKLGFFWFNGQFWVMPVTLSGTGSLDFYNLENEVTPVPYNDSASADMKKVLSSIKLKVVKEPMLTVSPQDFENSCVIIRDYTPQSDINSGIPRATLQEGVLSLEAGILPYMRTNLMNNTGVMGIKVTDQTEANQVLEAANAVDEAAKAGSPWVPILQQLDRQPLNNGGSSDSSTYLQAYQAVDNLRMSFLGINKSGIYDKSQYVNTMSSRQNTPVQLSLTDALQCRQDACTLINSVWPLGITCELTESVLGTDYDGDGLASDSQNGGNSNEPSKEQQPENAA